MILAAGFGRRLRPYTRYLPKVLFPIVGQPALLLTLRRLAELGVCRVAINLHHLPERIISAVKEAPPGLEIVFFYEPEILFTGGALKGAASFLIREPTLIINGDIVTNLDYLDLYQRHLASSALVTMAAKAKGGTDNLLVKGTKVVALRVRGTHTYCGIQVVSPELLDHLPEGPSDLIEIYQRLAPEGLIEAYPTKAYFCDFGTKESYLRLHEDLLLGKVAIPGFDNLHGPALIRSPAEDLQISQWAFIDKGVKIGPGAFVRRSVIWPGAEIPKGARLEDVILPPSILFMP
ncbi:sugar phosphate nucleotidyltransferase [Thermosulfuriphilus sp.]